MAANSNPHAVAAFSYAMLQRDPEFRAAYPWVRNAVVCVDSDDPDEVISDRVATYTGDPTAIACYFPSERRMRFMKVTGGRKASAKERQAALAQGYFTARDRVNIGELVRAVLDGTPPERRTGENGDAAEVSTATVEQRLVRS